MPKVTKGYFARSEASPTCLVAVRELWPPGQELVEVAAPARRVLAAAQALCLGGVEHVLDAPAQSLGAAKQRGPQGDGRMSIIETLKRGSMPQYRPPLPTAIRIDTS